jgi:Protein of unknown function (DUF3017)
MSARQLLRSQWPVMMVVLIFAVALLLAAENFWRRSALLIGIGVGLAAVLRLTLTEDRAGLLMVRSKGIDFVTMTLVATAMVYIAWTIDPLGTG